MTIDDIKNLFGRVFDDPDTLYRLAYYGGIFFCVLGFVAFAVSIMRL